MAAIQSITQQLSESVQAWGVRLNAFLTSIGPCGIQDLDLTRRDTNGQTLMVAAVTYKSPGSTPTGATVFVGTSAADAATQANTFLAANPLYRVLFMRDVSDPRRRGLNNDAVLLVYSTETLSNCAQGECMISIVEAVSSIAPGATGTALLVSSAGATVTAITVENRSALTWPAGGRGYAAPILGDCGWVGMPSCCAIPTSTTSTTSTTSSTTTAPPSCATDITSVVVTDLGYMRGAACEVQFTLLGVNPGETVTISPISGVDLTLLTWVSGPVPVDNGDGTWTFTFTNGDETAQFTLEFPHDLSLVFDMPYTTSYPPCPVDRGTIPISANNCNADITSPVVTDLGYVGGASCEVSFSLQQANPGEKVTISPGACAWPVTLTTVSGLAPVDNGDGTYTYTFVTGSEVVDFTLVFPDNVYVICGMDYVTSDVGGCPDLFGSIQLMANAGMAPS